MDGESLVIIRAMAQAWRAVLEAYEQGDCCEVIGAVERENERLYALLREREDAREHLRAVD